MKMRYLKFQATMEQGNQVKIIISIIKPNEEILYFDGEEYLRNNLNIRQKIGKLNIYIP